MRLLPCPCLDQKEGLQFFVAVLDSLAVSTRMFQRLIVEKGTN